MSLFDSFRDREVKFNMGEQSAEQTEFGASIDFGDAPADTGTPNLGSDNIVTAPMDVFPNTASFDNTDAMLSRLLHGSSSASAISATENKEPAVEEIDVSTPQEDVQEEAHEVFAEQEPVQEEKSDEVNAEQEYAQTEEPESAQEFEHVEDSSAEDNSSVFGYTESKKEEKGEVKMNIDMSVINNKVEEAISRIAVDRERVQDVVPTGYTLQASKCVAQVSDLLKYMVDTENANHVTLSFRHYGIDPVVFEILLKRSNRDSHDELQVTIPPVTEVDEDGNEEIVEEGYVATYRAIEVDGELYFACTSKCTDYDYMTDIIKRMFEAVYTEGVYKFRLVGPRIVMDPELEEEVTVNTLRLNPVELATISAIAETQLFATCKTVVEDGVTYFIAKCETKAM